MSWKDRPTDLILWALVGLVGAVFAVWAFPRVFPFFPSDWRVDRGEAVEIALGYLRALGETVEDPYVVAGLKIYPALEHRLHLAAAPGREAALRASAPGRRIVRWSVLVYPRGVRTWEGAYHLTISPAGEMIALEVGVPAQVEGEALDAAAARARTAELLRQLGVDPRRFLEPDLRRVERPGRTDLVLRYRDREDALGPEFPYGIEVCFAGDRLFCVRRWLDNPAGERFPGPWPEGLLWEIRSLAPYLLILVVALPFLRRYHEGQVGVAGGLRVFLLVFVCGVLLTVLGAGWTAYWQMGANTWQAVWLWGILEVLAGIAPLALVAALAWTVGEARCRERWGGKLAAFDAVLRGRFGNATVARAALIGPAAGLAVTAALLAALPALPALPLATWLFDLWSGGASWPGGSGLFVALVLTLFSVLVQLSLLPVAMRWLGRLGGAAALAVVSGVVFFPPLATFPPGSEVLAGVVLSAAVLGLFLAFDLLTAVLAALTVHLTFGSLPWLFTQDTFLQLQGALPLAVLAVPLVLSFRGLLRGEEIVYQWCDVPLHARRIAEQERRRMELETAQGIQRSILPALPPRLAGVELAHAYRPAGEVGGDFYDLTLLAGGRLALAVGDVAGHGVASGLVMSMARAALVVQVGFDPRVEAVFAALNRTLYQTARRSLLATLCYGVLDPRRHELVFASAGHLCPFLIRAGDGVRHLESPAYPLGVRSALRIRPRTIRVEAEDVLFLCSDGVVEAFPEDDDEVFGFERLTASLKHHAGAGPGELRDGVLADLSRFTDRDRPADDQTILVLRLPPDGSAAGAEEGWK